jgi:NAD(P)-dependent dehydrogenase (short-subunit alcohol dehydrogenase family)
MPGPTHISDAINLSGRVAIITGAGSGIGRAIAKFLAAAGAAVVVQDVVADRVDETVSLIRRAGGLADPAIADITNEQAVASFVKEATQRHGHIDVLCNNAGIMDKMETATEVSIELWNRVLAVNVTGHFLVTRAVLPHMLSQKKGSIINTASMAGLRGGTAGFAYTVSKHGVVGMTRSIAWAHRKDGIRCNAICPGAVDTNITGGAGFEAFSQDGVARLLPVLQINETVTSPDSLASVALFLASDASSFMSGAIIPVDGAWMAG